MGFETLRLCECIFSPSILDRVPMGFETRSHHKEIGVSKQILDRVPMGFETRQIRRS